MNFRLNESDVDRVFEKIAEGSRDGSFKELLQQDELRSVIQSGKAYADFREAVITHPPTFKLQKKERGICLDFCKADAVKAVYKTKGVRWHASCAFLDGSDSLLQPAAVPGSDGGFRVAIINCLNGRDYAMIESIVKSDHRPVHCEYLIRRSQAKMDNPRSRFC